MKDSEVNLFASITFSQNGGTKDDLKLRRQLLLASASPKRIYTSA
jgi:hypothetical protein